MLPATSTPRLLLTVGGAVLLLCSAVSAVRVGVTKCGGTIPIDSLYLLDPVWSTSPSRSLIERLSNGSLIFEKRYASAELREQIVMESGADLNAMTIFEVIPAAGESRSASGSLSASGQCIVSLDPLAAAMDGVVSRGARITFLNADPAKIKTCPSVLNVSLQPRQGNATSVYFARDNPTHSNSITLVSASDVTWPLTLTFSSECTLQLILLLNRYGAIDRWYVWIPMTAYTGVVVALLLSVVLLRLRLRAHVASFCLFLVFLGFFGSCVGLVVEVLQWQSSVARLYPFPDSVTLYCCLCVLYILLFIPVLYHKGNITILSMGVTRLIVFGLNCALCIGYWIMGYVILGSLAVLQFLITNFILTYYYAYVSVYLRRTMKGTSSLPKFSGSFVYLWCAPVTPFACCALMYYDLYLLTHSNAEGDAATNRLRYVVRVYSTQLSVPLLFFQNVYGVALLATASAYHTPLVTLLFAALLLCIVHAIFVVEQYTREWVRWRRLGSSFGFCGWISLSAVMKALLSPNYEAKVPQCALRNASPADSLSPLNAQRAPPPNQFEGGIVAYQTGEALFTPSTESDGTEVVFPPPPSSQHWGDNHGPTYQGLPTSSLAGITTPPIRDIEDGMEYWPNSVER
ncbi:hypothetical protein LSCM1_05861 [Leishmania martiniquensis]|uniref:Uncharacterized protein n=1 Tax=Leishmania martiniquensis TaxID=1580590 RepID=A0A836KQQ0_9TRYP|nr:hypothetical protein LSCM1_05861 [Leishmania martiniquensis]